MGERSEPGSARRQQGTGRAGRAGPAGSTHSPGSRARSPRRHGRYGTGPGAAGAAPPTITAPAASTTSCACSQVRTRSYPEVSPPPTQCTSATGPRRARTPRSAGMHGGVPRETRRAGDLAAACSARHARQDTPPACRPPSGPSPGAGPAAASGMPSRSGSVRQADPAPLRTGRGPASRPGPRTPSRPRPPRLAPGDRSAAAGTHSAPPECDGPDGEPLRAPRPRPAPRTTCAAAEPLSAAAGRDPVGAGSPSAAPGADGWHPAPGVRPPHPPRALRPGAREHWGHGRTQPIHPRRTPTPRDGTSRVPRLMPPARPGAGDLRCPTRRSRFHVEHHAVRRPGSSTRPPPGPRSRPPGGLPPSPGGVGATRCIDRDGAAVSDAGAHPAATRGRSPDRAAGARTTTRAVPRSPPHGPPRRHHGDETPSHRCRRRRRVGPAAEPPHTPGPHRRRARPPRIARCAPRRGAEFIRTYDRDDRSRALEGSDPVDRHPQVPIRP